MTAQTFNPTATPSPEIERRARRNAAAKMGVYRHALIYVLVNLGLFLLAWQQGRNWHIYPALGWGLGLTIHAASVFLLRASDLQHRMVEQERERLMQK